MSDYEEVPVLKLILEEEEEEEVLAVRLPIITSLMFGKFFGYREEMSFF